MERMNQENKEKKVRESFHLEPASIVTMAIDSAKSFQEASQYLMMHNSPAFYLATEAYTNIIDAVRDDDHSCRRLSVRRFFKMILGQNMPWIQQSGSVLCLLTYMNKEGQMECECANGDYDRDTNILSCHLRNVLVSGASNLRLGFSILGYVHGHLSATLVQLDKVFSGYFDNIRSKKETKEKYDNMTMEQFRKRLKKERLEAVNLPAFDDYAIPMPFMAFKQEDEMYIEEQPMNVGSSSTDSFDQDYYDEMDIEEQHPAMNNNVGSSTDSFDQNYYDESIALLFTTKVDTDPFETRSSQCESPSFESFCEMYRQQEIQQRLKEEAQVVESSYWEDLLMEEGLDDLETRESFGFTFNK